MVDFQKVYQSIQDRHPLILCLTNPVTINDVANGILNIGGSPIMAVERQEFSEILSKAQGLYINIGSLNSEKIKNYKYAYREAERLNLPVVIDAVGAGFTELRNRTIDYFLKRVPTVIHGNYSEITYIYNQSQSSQGVDSSSGATPEEMARRVLEISKRYHIIFVASGIVDIIGLDGQVYKIYNGSPMMEQMTGTGCMLSGLIGTAIGSGVDPLLGTLYATALMGLAGEKGALLSRGMGDFHRELHNELSLIDGKILEGEVKIERG